MLPVIEKLLILQDRDRRIQRLQMELSGIGPERTLLQSKTQGNLAALENAKTKARQIESDRKKLELEVEAKKQLIDRYATQQLQTRKNEEYRALAHQIATCKEEITKLEDQQIELMEQAETAALEVANANAAYQEIKRLAESQLSNLAAREQNLQADLAQQSEGRNDLVAAVDPGVLPRYDRLRHTKGESVIVGVEHGVCGGCRLRLPPQVLISCKGEQEITNCPNCGRILYFTRDMDLTAAE